MKQDQFTSKLDTFFQGPEPYRHFYLWHGEVDDVSFLLPSGYVQRLDMFRLASELSHYPLAQQEASELLRDVLRTQLRVWYERDGDQHPVLIVTGCELLARYRVGLQPFYEVLTDRTMVILVCSAADAAYDPAGRLPSYVRCEPGATLAYLSPLLEDDHVVEPS